jgi:hypothetical protein
MSVKQELIDEIETTHSEYLQLVNSIPEEFYDRPSANPAWTIGEVLYHITLGPPAIHTEIWMIRHAGWLFSALLNNGTSRVFNWGNALFARHPKRITREILARSYERGHAGLLASLRKMPETDFNKSVRYPESFVRELAGIVTVERLFRYIKDHFEIHASQIRERLG